MWPCKFRHSEYNFLADYCYTWELGEMTGNEIWFKTAFGIDFLSGRLGKLFWLKVFTEGHGSKEPGSQNQESQVPNLKSGSN